MRTVQRFQTGRKKTSDIKEKQNEDSTEIPNRKEEDIRHQRKAEWGQYRDSKQEGRRHQTSKKSRMRTVQRFQTGRKKTSDIKEKQNEDSTEIPNRKEEDIRHQRKAEWGQYRDSKQEGRRHQTSRKSGIRTVQRFWTGRKKTSDIKEKQNQDSTEIPNRKEEDLRHPWQPSRDERHRFIGKVLLNLRRCSLGIKDRRPINKIINTSTKKQTD